MPTNEASSSILCPFRRSHTGKTLCCEGPIDGCTVTLTFTDPAQRVLHQKIFCRARYQCCEIFRMVMEAKYEEE